MPSGDHVDCPAFFRPLHRMRAGFTRAIKILEHNRALLDRAAEQLLKSETLNQNDIERIKQQMVVELPVQAA